MAKVPSKSEDMWASFKELQTYVEDIVSKPIEGGLKRLEDVLRSRKQNFLTLLKNPPKDPKHRDELKKGITDGITLPGMGHQILSKELVDETLIISDMYNLNEYMALDLLCTAQQQMPYHPGLPRGLVAVLLYYDGRKSVVCALRALVQARRGISWTLGASDEVSSYVTKYTQELMDNGVIDSILSTLETLDLTKEIELLHQNRALGGPRHHRQVVDLFQSIRQGLADIMYCWSAQCGLPKDPTFRLINQLKTMKVEEDPTGKIDSVTLALQMALLYALDLSILQRREDGEEMVKELPLIADSEFMKALLKEFLPVTSPWECSGLQGMALLAFGLTFAILRLAPSSLHTLTIADEDEVLVDAANILNVFDFMHRIFLENETIYKEEFYVRRLHNLLTDFIVYMPVKVKEMKNDADETARTMQVYTQEGLEPPLSLPHHFEHLLLTVARLYKTDTLKLELMLDYWCPSEANTNDPFLYRFPPRQVNLFKFVRLGGDILPPAHFVPYLKMLCSISSSPKTAQYAFNLLKQNGTGSSATVSWTHFFKSLERYYSNLRQELPPSTDTVYQHRNYPRGITPQEIQGLQAVLSITRTVAEFDPVSRVALCDNPQWAPLTILLGLVSCSVPIPLKAELLLTLAALARSPVTANTLWYNLEASQILATIPSTSSYQPRGVQTELEEIESRNEEFPLTRAMLHLLDVLTNVPIPRLLGVGTRIPGFDPYLNFVVNSVFLRFNTRSYKHPEEKWDVAKSCLELLSKLLMQYEPQVSDFSTQKIELQGGGSSQVNSVPGFHLMVNLNSKTELLRLVLFLVDEGSHMLDSYTPFAGKASLEASMLSCLTLLAQALKLQQKFFTLLSNSGSSMLLTGLNKLLLGVNPRSGKADHLLNITKFVTYNSWLPHHSLAAVKILLAVSPLPSAQSVLVGLFTSTPALSIEIRHGFVECLEADDDEGEEEDEPGVQCNTKEYIFKLLQQCLNLPPPNLTHYLLGFSLKKDLRKTVFQQPGVLGFPRTCLHSMLMVLDSSIVARRTFNLAPKSRVLESSYCMLYLLCANVRTSESILRFLRARNDFLARHLSCLPFRGKHGASELLQMSWILKSVAVELKASVSTQQYSHLTSLVNILIREHGGSPMSVDVRNIEEFHMKLDVSRQEYRNSLKKEKNLLTLIKFLNFQVESIPQPDWEFFEPSQINELATKCEVTAAGGAKRLIDVKKLHTMMLDELAVLQSSSTSAQRPIVLAEIGKVLKYAIKQNQLRSCCSATIRYMDAWRQVAEVMFAVTPVEVLPYDIRFHLLLDTVNIVLRKVLSDKIIPELASLSSGVVLLLLVNLRHCCIVKQKQAHLQGGDSMTLPVSSLSSSFFLDYEPEPGVFEAVLANILEWILNSGVASQKLRANLYGSLLNFIHVACMGGSDKFRQDMDGSTNLYMSRLDSSQFRTPVREASEHRKACLETIVGFGVGLVDVLCHDCTGGHDVCKMLALSCLGVLIEVDPHTNWISYLSTRGYLKHLIDSLLDSDEKLISMLEMVPSTLSPLYVYESKMAMLCRVALSRAGSEMLLEQGVMGCLSSMAVFDLHPDIKMHVTTMELDFIPSVSSRYLQILFPALNLCDAILTSLGSDNVSCCVQIQHFLICHNEMLCMVLRCGNPHIQVKFLKEVARFTGIIARTTNQGTINERETDPAEVSVYLQRMHKLMLGLLSRFVVSESVIRDLTGLAAATSSAAHSGDSRVAAQGSEDSGEAVRRFLQIACNLALYAHNITASKGLDHRATGTLFSASLGDALMAERRGREIQSADSGQLALGVIVYQLVNCVAQHQREKAKLDILLRKKKSVPSMNTSELREIISETNISPNALPENRTFAAQHLNACISVKNEELNLYSFLVDNCLFLVWSHLDYYMLRAIPKSCFGTTYNKDTMSGVMLPTTEAAWRTSAEDISRLKQGLLSIFNDSFTKQILDTKKEMSDADKGFIEALVRRIKRLIQFVPVK